MVYLASSITITVTIEDSMVRKSGNHRKQTKGSLRVRCGGWDVRDIKTMKVDK